MKAMTRGHRSRGRSELALQRRLPPSRHLREKWCSIPRDDVHSGNHISRQASLRMNKEIPIVEKTLSDLFLAQLKDIYYAEKKIFRTLPRW